MLTQMGSKIKQIQGRGSVLEVFESPGFGQVAKIAGAQEGVFLQKYPSMQSELLAHVGACVHPEIKSALVVGGFDLEIAFELLRHTGMRVDFVQEEYSILEALEPFFPHFTDTSTHANFKHYSQIIDLDLKKYDLIIDLHTPNTHRIDGLQRMLGAHGMLLLATQNPLLAPKTFESTLQDLHPHFSVIMPFYNPYAPLDLFYLFNSKRYHPEADMLLQKIDMLEGLEHYNDQVHVAAFAQPQWLKNMYLGLIKN